MQRWLYPQAALLITVESNNLIGEPYINNAGIGYLIVWLYVGTSKELCGTFVGFHIKGAESYNWTAEGPQEPPKIPQNSKKKHRIRYLKMTNRQTKLQDSGTPNHRITPYLKEMPRQIYLLLE
jgi:hypothetical protein